MNNNIQKSSNTVTISKEEYQKFLSLESKNKSLKSKNELLAKQVEQGEKKYRLKKEKHKLQKKHAQEDIGILERKVDNKRDKNKTQSEKIQELEERNQQLSSENEDLKEKSEQAGHLGKQLLEKNKDLEQKFNELLNKKDHRIQELEKQFKSSSKGYVEHAEILNSQLLEENKNLENLVNDLEMQVKDYSVNEKKSKEKIENLEQENKELRENKSGKNLFNKIKILKEDINILKQKLKEEKTESKRIHRRDKEQITHLSKYKAQYWSHLSQALNENKQHSQEKKQLSQENIKLRKLFYNDHEKLLNQRNENMILKDKVELLEEEVKLLRKQKETTNLNLQEQLEIAKGKEEVEDLGNVKIGNNRKNSDRINNNNNIHDNKKTLEVDKKELFLRNKQALKELKIFESKVVDSLDRIFSGQVKVKEVDLHAWFRNFNNSIMQKKEVVDEIEKFIGAFKLFKHNLHEQFKKKFELIDKYLDINFFNGKISEYDQKIKLIKEDVKKAGLEKIKNASKVLMELKIDRIPCQLNDEKSKNFELYCSLLGDQKAEQLKYFISEIKNVIAHINKYKDEEKNLYSNKCQEKLELMLSFSSYDQICKFGESISGLENISYNDLIDLIHRHEYNHNSEEKTNNNNLISCYSRIHETKDLSDDIASDFMSIVDLLYSGSITRLQKNSRALIQITMPRVVEMRKFENDKKVLTEYCNKLKDFNGSKDYNLLRKAIPKVTKYDDINFKEQYNEKAFEVVSKVDLKQFYQIIGYGIKKSLISILSQEKDLNQVLSKIKDLHQGFMYISKLIRESSNEDSVIMNDRYLSMLNLNEVNKFQLRIERVLNLKELKYPLQIKDK